uniref:Uncharacterized protein n=1 Tax=Electrophorus electricus TaxID=8005 RepID=A0AAY5EI06_ELEEL
AVHLNKQKVSTLSQAATQSSYSQTSCFFSLMILVLFFITVSSQVPILHALAFCVSIFGKGCWLLPPTGATQNSSPVRKCSVQIWKQ